MALKKKPASEAYSDSVKINPVSWESVELEYKKDIDRIDQTMESLIERLYFLKTEKEKKQERIRMIQERKSESNLFGLLA